MSSWTGWALCGHEAPDLQSSHAADERVESSSLLAVPQSACGEAGREGGEWIKDLSRARRQEIGRYCKALIDTGRVDWIKSLHMEVKFVEYVPSSVSGENKLILAKPVAATDQET